MYFKATLLSLSAALTLVLASSDGPADAAGFGPAASSPMAAARVLVAQHKWEGAIEQLEAVNRPDSADWNHLMGVSLRRSATPDDIAAERYFDAALRIDPRHRGALADSGELYLARGNLPRAELRLAALDQACRFGCAEFTVLVAAVQRDRDLRLRVSSAR
jgi:tetratricopeptide (TPR) repeat protein